MNRTWTGWARCWPALPDDPGHHRRRDQHLGRPGLQQPGGADFSLHALGDAQHTTHLDLLGVDCVSGACDAAIRGLSLQDLQAGQAMSFHTAAHSGSATDALRLGDNREWGAADSQLS